jgi:hypothetical protein
MPRRRRRKLPDGMTFCPSCGEVLPETERFFSLNDDPDFEGMWDPYCNICMLKRRPKKSNAGPGVPRQTCIWCQDEKALQGRYWYRNRTRETGFDHICKVCRKDRAAQVRKRRRIRMQSMYGAKLAPKSKECGRCGKEKPISQFTRDFSRADGFCYHCKKCKSQWATYQRRRKLAQKGDD